MEDWIEVEKAIAILKDAMKEDDSYAYAWHSNISMMCYDAIRAGEYVEMDELAHEDAHRVGNDAASRFMKLCFDVETSQDMLIEGQ